MSKNIRDIFINKDEFKLKVHSKFYGELCCDHVLVWNGIMSKDFFITICTLSLLYLKELKKTKDLKTSKWMMTIKEATMVNDDGKGDYDRATLMVTSNMVESKTIHKYVKIVDAIGTCCNEHY